MKNLAIVFVLLLGSQFVGAHQDESAELARSGSWICYAQGKRSMGGPVGDMWQTVTGYGETQFEAMSDANQACFSRGLSSCTVNSCFER